MKILHTTLIYLSCCTNTTLGWNVIRNKACKSWCFTHFATFYKPKYTFNFEVEFVTIFFFRFCAGILKIKDKGKLKELNFTFREQKLNKLMRGK